MAAKTHLPAIAFETIAETLRNTQLPDVDLVIGIGSGGVVPAAMAAYELRSPMCIIWLNYRGSDHAPVHSSPQLCAPFSPPAGTKEILLVDDVVVSGKTLQIARNMLPQTVITTMALKGNADIVLFPDVQSCVQWPWNPIK